MKKTLTINEKNVTVSIKTEFGDDFVDAIVDFEIQGIKISAIRFQEIDGEYCLAHQAEICGEEQYKKLFSALCEEEIFEDEDFRFDYSISEIKGWKNVEQLVEEVCFN